MRATSRSRTVEPSVLARSTMLPNCSTVVSWPLTTTVAVIGLAGDVRQVADRARRDLRVLRADRGVDVGRRQVEADQLGRIDPDAHRALGAEQLRLADAGHALDLGQHVARRVVAQRDRVERRVVGREDREQQEVGARLVDAHALLRHRCRQARRRRATGGSARRPAPGRGWCRSAKVSVMLAGAVGLADRLHVDQAGRAVHLLLDHADARCLRASAPRRRDRRR